MRQLVRDALERLGIERCLVAIHQASFPASDDDLAHGAPASARGLDLVRFLGAQGFDGLLLGPGGVTSAVNPSPYDASLFARNPLALSYGRFTESQWSGLLDERELDALVATRPTGARVDHAWARAASARLLAGLGRKIKGAPGSVPDLRARRAELVASEPWLVDERRFAAVAAAAGHDDWTRWPADAPEDDVGGEAFVLAQLAAREQHAIVRRVAREAGMRLFADAQIGIGHRDRWRREALFLPGYAMGAPPSRTNPDGQPWAYPVLDPAQMGHGGAARRFVEMRLADLCSQHDGLRIDHPHGWVCPWVYRADGEPMAAVRAGARLHESPDLPDHPALAPLARVHPDQLDRALPRHHDHWVRALEPAQVEAYAASLGLVLEVAHAHGLAADDVLCEVLSTCPLPLAAAIARFGLGRFRVTQKARLDDPDDPYRGDRARPEDWMMVGTHDTPPLMRVVDGWQASGEAERRAAYLGGRLGRHDDERRLLAERCRREPGFLALAMVAELFLGPARGVILFWVDLFGGRDIYNRPGEVHPENWTLRVPADFERALAGSGGPQLPAALALALHARGLDESDEGRSLLRGLA